MVKLLSLALVVLLVALLAVAGYVAHLDGIVRHQFEGRRWTLPAQVYAAPLELYAGAPLTPADLERELQRLQYRRDDAAFSRGADAPGQAGAATPGRNGADAPGRYRREGNRFRIRLRAARFADESRPAQLLQVDAGAGGIEAMSDAAGAAVPIARFEPLLIGSIFPIHGEDRIVVTPDQVPPLLPAALKAVEDRNFDTHHGVDPLGMLRALWVDMRSGQWDQGGSTLTQQLVKNYFLDSRRTAGRKIREAVMAVLLERHFSKTDLMTAYINEIHLGQDGDRAIHGFGLASQFYFGKPLAELDLSEIATLVAVVRGPSYYDPRRHPDRALRRRNLVLSLMAAQRVIADADAQQAQSRPLGVLARGTGAYYPAYLDLVRRTLRRDYREQDLTEAGLTVFTNLEPRAQERAEQILDRELGRLDRLHHGKAPNRDAQPGLQGSVVVTAPQSGDVWAVVGGRDAAFDGFNRALDARRQIGSLVKPFVYLAALESGRYNAASIIQDVPVSIPIQGGKPWQPENFEHDVNGPVPVVRGLAQSLNLATINLGMDIGLPAVRASLKRFGIEAEPPQNPSLLLGAFDLTPLEVAQLYTGLANGGFRTTLRAVRAVISQDGKALKAFPLEVAPVAQPDAVYAVQAMMEQVMQHGTGRPALSVLPAGLTVAGKSGTSSDLRDSWFAGFDGHALAVVWVGYDDNRVTGLTGSAGALGVWDRLVAALGPQSITAAAPESLHEISIDFLTGYRPQPGCAADPVTVSVPLGVEAAQAPVGSGAPETGQGPPGGQGLPGGCPGGTPGGPPGTPQPGLLERAQQWLHNAVH